LVRFYLGLSLGEDGDFAAAIAELRKALSELEERKESELVPRWLSPEGYPPEIAIRAALGALLLDSGDSAGALPILQQVVREAPEHIAAHYQLAQALQRSGRATEAQTHLEIYRRLNQAREEYQLGRQLAREANDLAPAEQALRRALVLSPTLAAAHLELGRILALRGDPEARRHLEVARDNPALREEAQRLLQALPNPQS
jgi:tetratricopeptide (TPR) repeat protein